MPKLRITFDREKCIGAFNCMQSAPLHFKQESETKAELIESKEEDGIDTKDVACNTDEEQKIIEAAEKCPVNAITVIDRTTEKKIVDATVQTTKQYKEIHAAYNDEKEFVLDEKGYFLIRIVPEKQCIEVAFCGKRNQIEVKIEGKTPIEIYQTIIREKIINRPDHAAYLGRELQKAYTALQLGIPYVQDDELSYKKIT